MHALLRAILARDVLVVAAGVALGLAFLGFVRALAATVVDVIEQPYGVGWTGYPPEESDVLPFFPQSFEVGGRLVFYGDILKHALALLLTMVVAALVLRRATRARST